MPDTTASQTPPVESIDRALLALQELARVGARGIGPAELAGALDLTKTTVHRTLAALRFRGFVSQDPVSGAYALGPAAMGLADDFLSDENLPVLLHQALMALADTVGELVHLGVLNGSQVLYLDKVEPERAVLAEYLRAAGDRPVDPERVWGVVEQARAPGFSRSPGR